jgi:hypothetical protein
VYHFPLPEVWKCTGVETGIPFTTTNNSFFLNAGMSDCPASSQSGTGMNKNSDAGTITVPE